MNKNEVDKNGEKSEVFKKLKILEIGFFIYRRMEFMYLCFKNFGCYI